MVWLIVVLLIGSLSIVIFHKPPVKSVGAGWSPPRIEGPSLPVDLDDLVTAPVPKQAPMPDTYV